jgi:hypothetical protein
VRHSGTLTRNPDIQNWTDRYLRRDNLGFFADALGALAEKGVGNGGLMAIGLVGQRDIPGVTLRQAQSILRWDIRPSRWSHAFLIAQPVEPAPKAVASAPILEVALHPRTGEFPRPEHNGVGEGRLGLYRDREVDANVALLAVRMDADDAARLAERARIFNIDRLRYNLWESLGVWQAYLWAFGGRPNPLREAFPIPASAYVEMVYEEIGVDLTPGASERNSAPEHIWNAARWWHEAFTTAGRPITGFYVERDPGCSQLPAPDEPSTVSPGGTP